MNQMLRSVALRFKTGRAGFVMAGRVVFLAIMPALTLLAAACSKTKVEPFPTAGANREYPLGKKILFGEAGDSEVYRVSGWSSTEKEITWTDGPVAILQFTGIPPAASLRLKITAAALTNPPQLSSQPVEVYANGQKIAEWEVSGKTELTALIPSQAAEAGGLLKIELRLPKAVSPKQLGLSSDARVLGLSCFDLVINKVG